MNTRTSNRVVLASLAAAGMCCVLADSPARAQSLSDRIGHVMNQRARAQATNESKGRMLGVLLYTDLTLQFTDTPAREAIDYLKTALGINIIARYNDDRTGIGLDPDEPIDLDVVDKSALTVLELILDQCAGDLEDATWQLRDGFVEVGTKERLAAKNAQEIRYYPVRDLLFEPPHFDNAPDLDLDSALSQGGGGGGGGGGRGGGGGGGGFGGGGGSGGGGGGGGSGGGGGGSLFGDPGDEAERPTELEQAAHLVELISEIVEPEGWLDNGGDWGTIRYYQGTLIIRAPDFMHRQIGGYPFAIRPGAARLPVQERRFVTFTGGFSQVELVGLRKSAPIGGAAGGGGP